MSMTREEAIWELKTGYPKDDTPTEECVRYEEAVDMAIEALKREQKALELKPLVNIENSDLPERFTATGCSCLNCVNRHSVHCEPHYKKIYGYCGNWVRGEAE